MPTDIVYYPHAIRATAVSGGAELFCFTLLEDVQPGHNFVDLLNFAAAQVGPFASGTHMAAPDNRFSLPQLGTLFAVTVAGDYYISRDLSAHHVDTWYRSGANLGMRAAVAATSHLRLRATQNSILAFESLSAPEGALARARCRLCHVLNPQTGADPLVPTAGVALEGAATGGDSYTLGPISLNGTALKGVFDCQLDNNIVWDEESSHGDGFYTYCGIHRYAPRLTLRTRKTDYLATYGTRGTALSALTFYLREKLDSGIHVADGTSAHIKITATTGTIKARQVAGEKGVVELTVDLTQPDQNQAAYVIAVNQAIT